MSLPTIHLRYSEARVIVYPIPASVKDLLTYIYKELVPDPKKKWARMTKRTKVNMYSIHDYNGQPSLHTFGGFMCRIYLSLLQQGYEVKVYDERNVFPQPKLQGIGGFMHTQEQVFRRLVSCDVSGIADLCTRYGKTMIIANLCRVYEGIPIIILTEGKDTLEQLKDDLKKILGPSREVVQIGGGSRCRHQSTDVSVVSYDSLHLCNPNLTKLMIADEVHTLPVDSRIPVWTKFMHCRRIGLTGSIEGRFDGRDPLIEGLVGPVLVRKKYLDALKDGAVCELKILALRVPLPPDYYGDRNTAYKSLLFMNEYIFNMARALSEQVVSENTQMLMFIDNEKQADALADFIGGDVTVAMAKKLTNKQRSGVVSDMKGKTIKRCISSEIFATGMTFQDLHVVVNMAGGGKSTSCVQKPGRLIQVRPGKKCGTLFEFYFDIPDELRKNGKFEPPMCPDSVAQKAMQKYGQTAALYRDSVERFGVYKKNGYTIHLFDSLIEMQEFYQSHCV